jgi:2,3-bisphosphoglycerate-independent phosphoglycerate mutase
MSVISAHGQADGDTLFLFNYRSDRMREISTVLGRLDKPVDVDIPKDLVRSLRTVYFCDNLRTRQHITTMSRYNAEFPFPVAYPPQAMTNVLAEWLSKHGIRQAHIAGLSRITACLSSCLMSSLYVHTETEKYAHVTFFFNGGVEKQFEEEERHMIESPKVATYDKLPKMSVQGVANKVAEVVGAGKHEFVMCNFAPPDMVSASCFGRFLSYRSLFGVLR